MELSTALSKVRKLIERAEHPSTPKTEADACRAMADDIMSKYAIEEWQAMQKAQTGLKPSRIRIDIGEGDSGFLSQTAMLVNIVAEYCRCSSVWMEGSGLRGLVPGRMEYCWVYGYESDLRYFELLFTTVFLHVSDLINPKPDPALTRGENIRELRNGGLNWNEIAEAFGWRLQKRDGSKTTYRHKDTEEVQTWSRVVGRIKSDYAREVKARREEPFTLGRGGAGNANFRLNSIKGYLVRLRQRLQEQAGKRGTGTEIILRDRTQNITAAMDEDFPAMKKARNKDVRYNPEAYARGVRHANTVSLNPETAAAERKPLS